MFNDFDLFEIHIAGHLGRVFCFEAFVSWPVSWFVRTEQAFNCLSLAPRAGVGFNTVRADVGCGLETVLPLVWRPSFHRRRAPGECYDVLVWLLC